MRKLIVSIVLGFIVVAQGFADKLERMLELVPPDAAVVIYLSGGEVGKAQYSLFEELVRFSGHQWLIKNFEKMKLLEKESVLEGYDEDSFGRMIFVQDDFGGSFFVLVETKLSEDSLVDMLSLNKSSAYKFESSDVFKGRTYRLAYKFELSDVFKGINTYTFEMDYIVDSTELNVSSNLCFNIYFIEDGLFVMERSEKGMKAPVWMEKMQAGFEKKSNERYSFVGRNDVVLGVDARFQDFAYFSSLATIQRVDDDVEAKLFMKTGVQDERFLQMYYAGANAGIASLLTSIGAKDLIYSFPLFCKITKDLKKQEVALELTLNKNVFKSIIDSIDFDSVLEKLEKMQNEYLKENIISKDDRPGLTIRFKKDSSKKDID